MAVKVSDLKVTSLKPVLSDPSLAKYLPSTLFPEEVSLQIAHVSNAVSNGLRRAIAGEMKMLAMYGLMAEFTTSDPHHIPEMILARIKMIPIAQSVPRATIFSLNAVNDTAIVRDVFSAEISSSYGKLPFNENMVICTLAPKAAMNVKNIRVGEFTAPAVGNGMCVLAVNTASIAVDQQPFNPFEPSAGGITSSMSDPRVWRLRFVTNGSASAEYILSAGCEDLIVRLRNVTQLLDTIQHSGTEYVLSIPEGNDTIGNLYMRTILDLFPESDVVYRVGAERESIVTVRTNENINSVFGKVTSYLITTYESIRAQVSRI